MLMSGLSKGVLMLVMGALFTWILVMAFEHWAKEPVSPSPQSFGIPVPHGSGLHGPSRWQF